MYTSTKKIKQRQWDEAIPFLVESIEYFGKKEWIDQYRFFLLISLSSRSYKEIMLCNHAYCLLQLSRVKESKAMYESVLREYPENAVAQTQLHNMHLIEQAAKEMS